MTHLLIRACVALLAAGAAWTAQAQTWPTQPIRIIVPFTAGTGMDAATSTPEELSQLAGKDFPRWGEVIRRNGISAD